MPDSDEFFVFKVKIFVGINIIDQEAFTMYQKFDVQVSISHEVFCSLTADCISAVYTC